MRRPGTDGPLLPRAPAVLLGCRSVVPASGTHRGWVDRRYLTPEGVIMKTGMYPKMAWEERARARLASLAAASCESNRISASGPSISAFFPAYNDAATIGGLVA